MASQTFARGLHVHCHEEQLSPTHPGSLKPPGHCGVGQGRWSSWVALPYGLWNFTSIPPTLIPPAFAIHTLWAGCRVWEGEFRGSHLGPGPWVDRFRGNRRQSRREGLAGEGGDAKELGGPELEGAEALGVAGRASLHQCPHRSACCPARSHPVLCLCRSRGAVPEEGPDYHRHLRGSARSGHCLRGRLLQDQVSVRRSGLREASYGGQSLPPRPDPLFYAPTAPSGASAAGVGPKGWAKKQEQRIEETGPRAVNKNGQEHRCWKKTDRGSNSALPCTMTPSKPSPHL